MAKYKRDAERMARQQETLDMLDADTAPADEPGEDPDLDEGPEAEDEQPEMDSEKLVAALKGAVEDATDFVDEELAPERQRATAYYRGGPLGNEEEGRSQIVMTEVRDTVQSMLPELMRIFCGSDEIVVFEPKDARSVKEAEEKTVLINEIFTQENNGAALIFNALKDALVRKSGVFKWFLEEYEEVTEEDYSGLTADQYMQLMLDDDVEEELFYAEKMDPELGEPVIDCRVKRVNRDKNFRVEVLPPEEFFFARDTRDLDTCKCAGHRRFVTMSELEQMGYDPDEIREHGNAATRFTHNEEAQTRNPALEARQEIWHKNDPSLEVFEYFETYMRVDYDGDGIAELRKICSLGGSHYVLHHEVVPEIPFAIICPDPEPHLLVGQSVADQVIELQRIKTNVVRNTLDSLAQSINPRTEVVEGQVNLDDAMNTEIGALVRVRQPGMVRPIVEPFVGQYALPFIQYLDDVRSSRTGVSKASQGLDPDVLQSSTAAAVQNTFSAATARIELIARLFAETGLRRMFRGLLRLVARHQDKPKMIKLRGEWTEVNPAAWDVNCRMTVNVGLGTGQKAEKMQILGGIAAKQEQIMQQLGPVNPLCDLQQYRNTLAKMVELSGFKDTTKFFKDVNEQTIAGIQQSMAKDKKPSTDEVLAMIEQMKVKQDQQEATMKNQLEQLKTKLMDDRERDKLIAQTMLKAEEIFANTGYKPDLNAIRAEVNRERSGVNGG